MPASSFGDSFQSPMLRMVPLRRPVCWAVKLANCMWNKMSSHKSNILPLKPLNLFRITSYAAGFCTWNLMHKVSASTCSSPVDAVAFNVAPPFVPNIAGSSVLWNTLNFEADAERIVRGKIRAWLFIPEVGCWMKQMLVLAVLGLPGINDLNAPFRS